MDKNHKKNPCSPVEVGTAVSSCSGLSQTLGCCRAAGLESGLKVLQGSSAASSWCSLLGEITKLILYLNNIWLNAFFYILFIFIFN